MPTPVLSLVDARLAARRRRLLAHGTVIRISVAVAVLALETASLTIDANPFLRPVAYISLLLRVPYYLCARGQDGSCAFRRTSE